MNPKKMTCFKLGLALLLSGSAYGAAAQVPNGLPNAVPNPYGNPAGDALTRNLKLIADQPRNVSALIGAGHAALDLGDPQAALTFFARAEEIAPSDGRVKAGMGACFVQMEKASEALNFFREASSLGVPEAEFAGDRGLAYDLTGDPRRAQADYTLSLRRLEDPEVRRRLALSQAISGDRAKALATIDGQLRSHDRAAWRVRSFILALTGDAGEATRSAQSVMPMQAAQMQPFFAALPGLNAADRAAAVHFGHFPEGPGALQTALAQAQYASAATARSAVQPAPQQTASNRRTKDADKSSRRKSEARQADANRENTTASLADRYSWGRGYAPRKKEESKPVATADASRAQRTATPATIATQVPPPAASVVTQAPKPALQQPVIHQQQAPVATAQTQVTAPPMQAPLATSSSSTQTATAITPLQAPVAAPSTTSQIASAAPSLQLPTATPSTSGIGNIAPGFSLGATQPVTVSAPPQPSVQTAEIAPSTIQTQFGTPAAASTSTAATSAPRSTGLAGIAAAIESLPTETPAAPQVEPKPSQPAQLALNTATKPAYGPKFETTKAETTKAAPDKKKEEPAKKELAKKDEPKAAAASKKVDAKSAAATKADDPKATAKKDAAAKTAKKEEPKEPSRHWVQIAGGANDAAMTREFLRLKDKAPKLLAARTPWTTPLKATNRLLVGPFKSADEAQDFVNELSKSGVPAFSWTSPAGQEIAKLASK